MKFKIIVIAIILILCSSCSFINENDDTSEPVEHPDLTLINTTYKVSTEDNSTIILDSSTIDFYYSKNLAILDNVTFSIVNNSDETISNGSCDSVQIDTKNNNVDFIDNVNININDPQFSIICDNISWNNDNKTLSTNAFVNVDSQYGKFEGTGFSANISTRYFEFKQIDKGELYEENN